MAPLDACRAALAIRQAFEQIRQQPEHPLSDFRMGIGIAHGRAVAGKIGTSDQVKVTVFGPVVNLASRLEAAQDDKAAQFEIGVEHAIEQCQQLIEEGVPGIHFYVLNRMDACDRILEALDLPTLA